MREEGPKDKLHAAGVALVLRDAAVSDVMHLWQVDVEG